MRLSSRDLYRLNRAHLEAQRTALRARLAHQALQELSLELERRYGLLGKEVDVDAETGAMRAKERPVLQPSERKDLSNGPE